MVIIAVLVDSITRPPIPPVVEQKNKRAVKVLHTLQGNLMIRVEDPGEHYHQLPVRIGILIWAGAKKLRVTHTALLLPECTWYQPHQRYAS